MDWEHLILEKEKWQENTFNAIKSDLIAAKNNSFVRYENSKENHLVMIYGKSQVGKTALILNMIGIKDEYSKKVYETLRAGVTRGNSSTSTAIIYSKSDTDQYGCSLSAINELTTKDVSYYDEAGIIKRLKEIREDVESNRMASDKILFIYIPNQYFVDDSATNNISIMDMPGVESRNHKEDLHVRNLLTRYIPISSVCIIACHATDIQSLETTELPDQTDWKNMVHRCILVVTHSYSAGTIKCYFKTDTSKRERNFYDYVKEVYKNKIGKILGENPEREVYPIDVGDSFKTLCDEEIQDETDRKEIIDTRDRILSELRQSIINHKGERLKSAIEDLKAIAVHYGEEEIKEISENVKLYNEKIAGIEKRIESAGKYIELLNNTDDTEDEEENIISSLESRKQKILDLKEAYIHGLSSEILGFVESNNLYKERRGRKYLKDKEKSTLRHIREYIFGLVEEFLKNLIKTADLDDYINKSDVLRQIDTDYILAKESKLYPPKNGLFSGREKVYFEDTEEICNSIQYSVNLMLKSCMNQCIEAIDSSIQKEKNEQKKIADQLARHRKRIQELNSEIDDYNKEISELIEQQEIIKKKKQQDEETLKIWLSYAHEAYMAQRDDIVMRINTSSSSDEKLMQLLLLGLLDKNYENVMGGVNDGKHN